MSRMRNVVSATEHPSLIADYLNPKIKITREESVQVAVDLRIPYSLFGIFPNRIRPTNRV